MKNFNIKSLKFNAIFLICLALLTTTFSCKEKAENKPDSDYEQQNDEARKEMKTHLILLDNAAEMYRLYDKQRLNITKSYLQKRFGANFNDTRTVWFDISTIKEYIKYVEERSAKAGVKVEGLEFYFAVKPSNIKSDERGHQTFFIAPTTNDKNKQSGYTLINNKKVLLNGHFSQTLDSLNMNTQKASFFTTITTLQEDGLLLNRGTANPPGNNN